MVTMRERVRTSAGPAAPLQQTANGANEASPPAGRSGLRRGWRRLLLVVVIGMVGAWGWRGGLWPAWAAWLRGPSAPGRALWPATIFWWGRAGKVLEFLGGLAVLLDLVDPARLRALATRAAQQRNEFRRAHMDSIADTTIRDLKHKTMLGLTYSIYYSTEYHDSQFYTFLVNPEEVPRGAGFTLEQYREMKERFDAERGQRCAHPAHSGICDKQNLFLGRLADELVEQHLAQDMRAARDRRESQSPSALLPAAAGLSAVLIFSMLFVSAYAFFSHALRSSLFALLPSLFLTSFFLWALSQSGVVYRLGLRLRYGLVLTLGSLVADLLDGARPGHKMRWLAFFLFLFGFHFDLLSS
jgi:hypothetical protein